MLQRVQCPGPPPHPPFAVYSVFKGRFLTLMYTCVVLRAILSLYCLPALPRPSLLNLAVCIVCPGRDLRRLAGDVEADSGEQQPGPPTLHRLVQEAGCSHGKDDGIIRPAPDPASLSLGRPTPVPQHP
jgi:hypothetical protein